ncbi:MAG: FKBP-type peptidyl-prolyl cis-trans isomerase [Candidatus Pedobacter colombiensis]|uniref:Peptidyl-prolyl cis-trans isomerase n=1 Tax=Candidatus Pedobacter colombiensis TaxID=3121371 RepID=A0AAJ6B6D6_9SPHI|nr:FKBP-type peptidyl-prolyl cis-trans isomerase [Pedobacter sp.]WEK18814.1 MAG: FKBP-type peptidyl-prolyl cis-trans isomerase [Pedobacter sp.]
MLKTSILLGLFLLAVAFVACKKEPPYDAEKELDIDDAIIAKYLLDSAVTATKDSSGLYYKIISPGTGNEITNTDTVYGNYTLKILKDTVLLAKSVDSTFKFMLPGYIKGWQIGVGLIRPGGSIRMIIPSALGYQNRAVTSPIIPPNSILDITLSIVSINKKPK